MNLRQCLSPLSRTRYGGRRWVYLPYAAFLVCILLIGVVEEEGTTGLWFYLVTIPCFVLQYARPTFAGWLVTFTAWLFFCGTVAFLDYDNIRTGIYSINIWLVLCTAVVSSTPLYVFSPRLRDVGQGGDAESQGHNNASRADHSPT